MPAQRSGERLLRTNAKLSGKIFQAELPHPSQKRRKDGPPCREPETREHISAAIRSYGGQVLPALVARDGLTVSGRSLGAE